VWYLLARLKIKDIEGRVHGYGGIVERSHGGRKVPAGE